MLYRINSVHSWKYLFSFFFFFFQVGSDIQLGHNGDFTPWEAQVWFVWPASSKEVLQVSGRVVLQQVGLAWLDRGPHGLSYCTSPSSLCSSSQPLAWQYPHPMYLLPFLSPPLTTPEWCGYLTFTDIVHPVVVFLRECQVKHWPKHKKVCELMAEATGKIQKDLQMVDWEADGPSTAVCEHCRCYCVFHVLTLAWYKGAMNLYLPLI